MPDHEPLALDALTALGDRFKHWAGVVLSKRDFARLVAELGPLRVENAALKADNARLRARLAGLRLTLAQCRASLEWAEGECGGGKE